MKENYLIICNPSSGKGIANKILIAYEDFLTKQSIQFKTYERSYPSSLNEFTTMVIIGGDGTINHTINHFAEILIPIAFIKGGTGNDYASLHLGNASLEKQFQNTLSKQSILVDAGICNNQKFLNGVGIGFDGWVVKKNIGKRFFTGIAAYYSTIISLLLFYKESETSIQTNQGAHKHITFMLTISKSKTYGGGFKVAPNAHPSNGFFEFISIGKIGLLNRIRYLPVIEKGNHLNLKFVNHHQTKSAKIKSENKLQAHLDGEWMEANEFEIILLPSKYQIKSIAYFKSI
jgi:diacylglycerol kinase (ATP)